MCVWKERGRKRAREKAYLYICIEPFVCMAWNWTIQCLRLNAHAYMYLYVCLCFSNHYNPIDVCTILRTNRLHFFSLMIYSSTTMYYFFVYLFLLRWLLWPPLLMMLPPPPPRRFVFQFSMNESSAIFLIFIHGLFPCCVLHTFCSGDCHYFR